MGGIEEKPAAKNMCGLVRVTAGCSGLEAALPSREQGWCSHTPRLASKAAYASRGEALGRVAHQARETDPGGSL